MENQSSEVKGKSTAAIVGLVLGIVALVTSFVPFVNNLSFILALIGTVFAVVGLVGTLRGKRGGKGLAIASTIVNVLALVIVLATQSMYSAALDEAVNSTSTASTTTTSAPASDTSAAAADSADKYTIAGEALTGDSYTSKITGTFTNNSGEKLSYVSVSYSLFDAEGNQVDTAYASTSNLDAGGAWKYEATSLSGTYKVASFKLGDVTTL